MTRMCCQCHKVEQEGYWAQSPTLFGRQEQITHGYCPECFDKALGAIDQYITGKRLQSYCLPNMSTTMAHSMQLCV